MAQIHGDGLGRQRVVTRSIAASREQGNDGGAGTAGLRRGRDLRWLRLDGFERCCGELLSRMARRARLRPPEGGGQALLEASRGRPWRLELLLAATKRGGGVAGRRALEGTGRCRAPAEEMNDVARAWRGTRQRGKRPWRSGAGLLWCHGCTSSRRRAAAWEEKQGAAPWRKQQR